MIQDAEAIKFAVAGEYVDEAGGEITLKSIEFRPTSVVSGKLQ